ncbi:LysR substrate-binding domain-containing protein [Paenibacillus soyae]|uniref:LysR substrate-binding domain-containing protein n=1 Tax=Paenibacillus soyae TaxID=2969249 RepID=A0A9X2SC37_9BACL|nr:LysR substrate-binding domain-containing protein [Paenibacillus soyae]MCR2806318.1 LysR substrate-binding domain-containing protein [Paenibacillus soyae]
MMDLHSLRYFQTVARLENMTKAAEKLQISQPALSKLIGKLETELSVQLFDRTGKYIRLNEFGKRFLTKVDLALQTLEDGKTELIDLAAKPIGTIAVMIHVGSYLLPDMIASFRQRHPEAEFKLLQHDQDRTASPAFDLCISSSTFRMPGTESIPLLTEEIMLAVPNGHRLAGRKSVRLSELSEDGFISLKPGKQLRDTTDSLCRAAGFEPRMIYECDEPSMVRSLVRAGLGVSFIPSVTWGGSQGSSVVLLSIEEPVSKRSIEISWYADRYITKAAREFKAFVQDYYRKLQ